MKIAFRDFRPLLLKSGFLTDEYENFPSVVQRANAWLAKTNARVINVETVLCPSSANGSADGLVRTAEQRGIWHNSTYCYQVLRVWHEA
jgi:hypothetical protein